MSRNNINIILTETKLPMTTVKINSKATNKAKELNTSVKTLLIKTNQLNNLNINHLNNKRIKDHHNPKVLSMILMHNNNFKVTNKAKNSHISNNLNLILNPFKIIPKIIN